MNTLAKLASRNQTKTLLGIETQKVEVAMMMAISQAAIKLKPY